MNKYINKKLEYHCLQLVRDKSWNYFLLLKDTCNFKNLNAIDMFILAIKEKIFSNTKYWTDVSNGTQ